MKIKLRWLITGLLALSLTSCGVFFAPLEGRWNPNDDKFGDGFTEKSLYPTLDGHLMDPATPDFYSPTMSASNTRRAMMKFDTSGIPANVAHAQLQLFLNMTVAPAQPYRIRLILQDWDPSTVTWTQLNSPGFLSGTASPDLMLSNMGMYYSWDVTALLRSVLPGSVKGLLVEPAQMAAMNADFSTTENVTSSKPVLVIWAR